MNFITAIFYGTILSLVHFFSDNCSKSFGKYQDKILSFAAGISIAYLFMRLLPDINEATTILKDAAYLSILAGFVLLHISEKYVYQHAKAKRRLRELKEAHSIAFFIYYFVVGSVIYFISSNDIYSGLLFMIPIVIGAAVGVVSTSGVHESIRKHLGWKVFLSSSSLLGVLVTHFIKFPATLMYSLLGLAVGAIFYIVVRDVLPKEKEGDPKYFTLGVVSYAILLIALSSL